MPTRKQRRRRAKEQRHEWELVEIDPDTGEERPVEPVAADATRAVPAKKGQPKPKGRPPRKVNPPSWTKVWKRSLIFAPFMFLTVTLLDSKLAVSARLFQTFLLLAFFIPFSYAMDTIAYRTFIRRGGVPAEPTAKKKA